MGAKFDAVEWLKLHGARESYPGEPAYLEDGTFYYRLVGNDIQVAVKKSFDRWANSIDFVFARPKTEKAFQRVKAKLWDALVNNRWNKAGGDEIRL